MSTYSLTIFSLFLSSLLVLGSAAHCGQQAGAALCPGGLCCSRWGWCGTTDDYCGDGCQSQCTPEGSGEEGGGEIGGLITREMFDQMLLHRNNVACPARNFYTYDAFTEAAKAYPAFSTTGDDAATKREIAAFLAQTSHETTGGWDAAPDGPYAWGYCFNSEVNPWSIYCENSPIFPCVPGKSYHGRGPIQLSWNYNYGQFGNAIGMDLLSDPDKLTEDVVLSFKSAFWFWMTEQLPKPSCHDVITGNWSPSASDQAAGRFPGFGLLTNIINGGIECGHGWDARVDSRIGFYRRYCDILGVDYGDNLDCYNQRPFGWGALVDSM